MQHFIEYPAEFIEVKSRNSITALPLNKRQRQLCGELVRHIIITLCKASYTMTFSDEYEEKFDEEKQDSASKGALISHMFITGYEGAVETLLRLGILEKQEIVIWENPMDASDVVHAMETRTDLTLQDLSEALSGFFDVGVQGLDSPPSTELVSALFDCGIIDSEGRSSKFTTLVNISGWGYRNGIGRVRAFTPLYEDLN